MVTASFGLARLVTRSDWNPDFLPGWPCGSTVGRIDSLVAGQGRGHTRSLPSEI